LEFILDMLLTELFLRRLIVRLPTNNQGRGPHVVGCFELHI